MLLLMIFCYIKVRFILNFPSSSPFDRVSAYLSCDFMQNMNSSVKSNNKSFYSLQPNFQKFDSNLEWLSFISAQGHIYVANEYPTFARTMLTVCPKLGISMQITVNWRQILSVLMKKMQILGYNIQILKFYSILL